LQTYLTDAERCFVKKRLAEEEAALRAIIEDTAVLFVRLRAA
jgi:hypothetical protein